MGREGTQLGKRNSFLGKGTNLERVGNNLGVGIHLGERELILGEVRTKFW